MVRPKAAFERRFTALILEECRAEIAVAAGEVEDKRVFSAMFEELAASGVDARWCEGLVGGPEGDFWPRRMVIEINAPTPQTVDEFRSSVFTLAQARGHWHRWQAGLRAPDYDEAHAAFLTTDVVDASVVLTARREGAVVVTSDASDLRRLDPSPRLERV